MSDNETFDITLHRTELVPGGNGIRLGYSDNHPGRQFLIIPKNWMPISADDRSHEVYVSDEPPAG
jgi:hypothetical protein